MNTQTTYNELLKEYFYTGLLLEKEYKKYNLIKRYINLVSPRLKKEKDALLNKGKNLYEDLLIKSIFYKNPILDEKE